jgi:hypothetical protein
MAPLVQAEEEVAGEELDPLFDYKRVQPAMTFRFDGTRCRLRWLGSRRTGKRLLSCVFVGSGCFCRQQPGEGGHVQALQQARQGRHQSECARARLRFEVGEVFWCGSADVLMLVLLLLGRG